MTDSSRSHRYADAERLRDALRYTAAQTSFSAALIEKDYYCSLILAELAPLFANGLVFKGGTALTKIHADFYRLSEDLDFVIAMPTNSSRADRRKMIEPVKQHMQNLQGGFLTSVPAYTASNNCRQYQWELFYLSCLSGETDRIKVEVSLREPLLAQVADHAARAILIDPHTTKPAVPHVRVTVMSRQEAYAEKIRAALCRQPAAIRDFYDLDYAIRFAIFDEGDPELHKLVRQKTSVPGNAAPDTSDGRFDELRRQLDAALRPVLRPSDYGEFDLERAFELIRRIERLVR